MITALKHVEPLGDPEPFKTFKDLALQGTTFKASAPHEVLELPGRIMKKNLRKPTSRLGDCVWGHSLGG